MRILILIIISTFFKSILCFSMSYVPIPFEKQIEESYGIVEGRYASHEYKKNKNGQVVTVYTFIVDRFIGIKKNEILNQKYFQVTVPGGVWQEEIHQIHGVPHFNKDENLVLLLNKGPNGFELNNLGLGKYIIHNLGSKKVISSSVFPGHPKLSNIDYSDYVELVNKNYKMRFVGFNNGKKVFLQDKRVLKKYKGRMPASIQAKKIKDEKKNSISIYWLVIILGLLGIGSGHYMRNKN